MALRDYEHDLSFEVAEAPALNTNSDTAIVSEIIDTANCQGVTFVICCGTLTDTNATFATSMEQGDASNLSDTAAASTVGSDITRTMPTWTYSTGDLACFAVGYIGPKRYCRLTITPSGNNSGDAPISLIAIKHGERVHP